MSSTTSLLSTICIHSICECAFWSRIWHFNFLNFVSLLLNERWRRAWNSHILTGTRRMFYSIYLKFFKTILFSQWWYSLLEPLSSYFASIFYQASLCDQYWVWILALASQKTLSSPPFLKIWVAPLIIPYCSLSYPSKSTHSISCSSRARNKELSLSPSKTDWYPDSSLQSNGGKGIG